MGRYNNNWIDDTTLEFPQFGFWLLHIVSAIVLFLWGMKFAARRAPFPIMAYRALKMLMKR